MNKKDNYPIEKWAKDMNALLPEKIYKGTLEDDSRRLLF